MRRTRLAVAMTLSLLLLMTLAPAALAGEYAPGKGYNGAAGHANSECVYNGQDDIDIEDDFIWASTPAKGRVQSGGQLIAAQAQGTLPIPGPPPGVQGIACNGHLSPLK